MKNILFMFSLILLSFILILNVEDDVFAQKETPVFPVEELVVDGDYSTIIDSYAYEGNIYVLIYVKSLHEGYNDYVYSIITYDEKGILKEQKEIYSCREYDQATESEDGCVRLFTKFIVIDQKMVLTDQRHLYTYDLETNLLTDHSNEMNGLKLSEINDFTIYYDSDDVPHLLLVGQASSYQQLTVSNHAVIAMLSLDFELKWVNLSNMVNSTYTSLEVTDHLYIIVVGNRFKASEKGEIHGGGRTIGTIARYDFLGNFYWEQESKHFFHGLKKSDDGNVLLYGRYVLKGGIVTNDKPVSTASLVKMDPKSGETIWESNYVSKTKRASEFVFVDVEETKENEFYAIGYQKPYEGNKPELLDISYNFHNPDFYSDQKYTGFIVKINKNGNPLWVSEIRNAYLTKNHSLENDLNLITGIQFVIHGDSKNYMKGFVSKVDLESIEHQRLNRFIDRIKLPLVIVGVVGIFGFIHYRRKIKSNKTTNGVINTTE